MTDLPPLYRTIDTMSWMSWSRCWTKASSRFGLQIDPNWRSISFWCIDTGNRHWSLQITSLTIGVVNKLCVILRFAKLMRMPPFVNVIDCNDRHSLKMIAKKYHSMACLEKVVKVIWQLTLHFSRQYLSHDWIAHVMWYYVSRLYAKSFPKWQRVVCLVHHRIGVILCGDVCT